ncbi:MAG: hypothetical protein H6Q65_30 [Firmicutes bacterium]|nr:hypothetical protein [Bacillota bacterium]
MNQRNLFFNAPSAEGGGSGNASEKEMEPQKNGMCGEKHLMQPVVSGLPAERKTAPLAPKPVGQIDKIRNTNLSGANRKEE